MFTKVLFPTDFSAPAIRLLECLGTFRPLGVEEVVLLHVTDVRQAVNLLGSVSQYTVRHAPVPVLLMKVQVVEEMGRTVCTFAYERMLRKVLLPTDFSECAKKHGLVIGRKEGLWVHYRLAKPASPLHGALIGSLGTWLGDPEVFGRDRRELERVLSCSRHDST